MIINSLIKNAPIIGSAYGFATTARKVTKCSTPTGAVLTAAKGVVIDCTPPVNKYPALCLALAACSIASVSTAGNPLCVSATITIGEAIVECTLD